MQDFKVGQRVVCVDDSASWFGGGAIRKGQTYTIDAVHSEALAQTGIGQMSCSRGVRLVGVQMPTANDWFRPGRFQPED